MIEGVRYARGGDVRAAERVTDEQAMRACYDAHFGRLAGWATKLVGDPDLAHDLATEAFLKLLRDFRSIEEPRAWLYAVTANLVRDHWRKRGREAAAYARWQAGAEESWTGPDQTTRLTVRDAVEALPDRLRSAVMLHYFADLPVTTVATLLQKSEGAVKRDLFDARKRMATMLEEAR